MCTKVFKLEKAVFFKITKSFPTDDPTKVVLVCVSVVLIIIGIDFSVNDYHKVTGEI